MTWIQLRLLHFHKHMPILAHLTVIFEDVLLKNMFSIGSSTHCLIVSPMFWILMLLIIFFLLFVAMASMNWYIQSPKRE